MEDECCATCGQSLKFDDVTEECELKWVKTGDKYLVQVKHQDNSIIHLGPGCKPHQPTDASYRIKEIYETADGSGWWFQVLKRR